MDGNSIATKPKSGKIQKVDMDTLIVGFLRKDFKGILAPHDNPLVISTRVHGYDVSRTLVDDDNSTNVMFWDYFKENSARRG